ncbi:MAG: hypothetical protein M3067_09085 [Chloroflexota bacterium]|nr:hypothetical protein [Chloroflexota bacterium]
MGLILSLVVAACAQGQSAPTNPAGSANPAASAGSAAASVAAIRDAELSLRQEIRTRAGLANVGPGALELAALMNRRESVALNALKADVSATSQAPHAVLVDAPTPGQSITGPVSILTGAFGDTMTEGVTNTRTLDDNAFPGGCVAGMGICSGETDNKRSGTKTVTEHGCDTGTCEGAVIEKVNVAGHPGEISTQTTLTAGFDGSTISMQIEIKTKGEIFDATSKALVYRIESTGSGRMTGDACPDASGISKLRIEFSAYEN